MDIRKLKYYREIKCIRHANVSREQLKAPVWLLSIMSVTTFGTGPACRGVGGPVGSGDRCSFCYHKGNKSTLAVPTVNGRQQPLGRVATFSA